MVWTRQEARPSALLARLGMVERVYNRRRDITHGSMLCHQGDTITTPGVILRQCIVMSHRKVSPTKPNSCVNELKINEFIILVSAIYEPHPLPNFRLRPLRYIAANGSYSLHCVSLEVN